MQTITTIGLDLAKSVFQVHGVDAGGQGSARRHRRRRPAPVSGPGARRTALGDTTGRGAAVLGGVASRAGVVGPVADVCSGR